MDASPIMESQQGTRRVLLGRSAMTRTSQIAWPDGLWLIAMPPRSACDRRPDRAGGNADAPDCPTLPRSLGVPALMTGGLSTESSWWSAKASPSETRRGATQSNRKPAIPLKAQGRSRQIRRRTGRQWWQAGSTLD